MKKSQVIALLIMIIFVTVLVIVGIFVNDNTNTLFNPGKTDSNKSASPKQSSTIKITGSVGTPGLSATPSNAISNSPVVTGTPSPTSDPSTASPSTTFSVVNKDLLSGLSTARENWGVGYDNKIPVIPFKVVEYMKKYKLFTTHNTDQKVIYLTFDEGYENGQTTRILDTLKAKNTQAIFFVTGAYIDSSPDLVKRMVNEGHLVGNHTNKHKIMPELSVDDFIKDLMDTEAKFRSVVGQDKRMFYYRPPEGSYSERDLSIATQLGYTTVLWSFAYADYNTEKPLGNDVSYQKVMDKLHSGAVYLLHAVSKDNADILGRVIDDMKSQGYSVKRIDQ